MRTLVEADGALVIQAPVWIGVALIVLGIALTVAVFVRKVPRRAARLSALLGTVLLLFAGWHLTASRTTFEPRGFFTESIYGEEQRVGWLQVGNAVPAADGSLTLHLRSGGETSVDLAGLSEAERARVAGYVRARLRK